MRTACTPQHLLLLLLATSVTPVHAGENWPDERLDAWHGYPMERSAGYDARFIVEV